MNINKISAGENIPHSINVIIEIPAQAGPVKYEIDKESGALIVDRFMGTSMVYPTNYGFIPHTLSKDGDPLDVLVLTPAPLIHGAVITCRPVGVLNMTDESGPDAKILAVPNDKTSLSYQHIKSIKDVDASLLKTIAHFFEHYKDLEDSKWVKIEGWDDVKAAEESIRKSVEAYKGKQARPRARLGRDRAG
ncbi:MAG: inorganic diphosphatase [Gammaproteobacteria bacterium]